MARYFTRVQTPWPAERAFAYVADLRNFAEWDPGVTAVEQLTGDGPGPDAAYSVTVTGAVRPMTLRYETTAYDPPRRIEVRAESSSLLSIDVVTVEPVTDGAGSIVTYDATLTFRGLARLADPLLALGFRRIGDRAAAGLRTALEGTATTR